MCVSVEAENTQSEQLAAGGFAPFSPSLICVTTGLKYMMETPPKYEVLCWIWTTMYHSTGISWLSLHVFPFVCLRGLHGHRVGIVIGPT